LANITRQVPSGIPFPDSVSRISIAGAVLKLAYADLVMALQRWKNFVTKKIVPDDLMDRDRISARSKTSRGPCCTALRAERYYRFIGPVRV
jgi:hypothetical protein